MENRPPAYLKAVAMELATLLHEASSDKKRIGELKEQLESVLPVPDSFIPASPREENKEDEIGIWKRIVKNGHSTYIRDIAKRTEWIYWADLQMLPPKGAAKRVILLGESVARGFLYEPFYTVAKELQGLLDTNAGPEKLEVIDLARTSIHMEQLLQLAAKCLALKPDAIIVYAGNNWAPEVNALLQEKDLQYLVEICLKESFNGVKTFLEDKFKDRVQLFLKRLQELFAQGGIEVIYIIPAFNLKDWHSDDVEKELLWLPEGKRAAWLKARDSARTFKLQKNAKLLAQAAGSMVAIDPSNAEGYELQAAAYLLEEDWEAAGCALELARDTVILEKATGSKPRCYHIVRETILRHADEYGIKVVDAVSICQQSMKNDISGRELFLDYCHHTVKGIKIIMRNTASMLLSLLEQKQIPPDQIKSSGIFPGKDVAAITHFCAAIHNAHYGQEADILNYHCQKAIDLSLVVKEPMLRYVDFSTRYASTLLCRSFEEIFRSEYMRQYEGGLGLMHPRGSKLMDIALNDAIARCLHTVNVDIEQDLLQLRKKEHGIQSAGTNLLESFYSRTCYNEFKTMPVPGFLQARSTETKLYFVADEHQSLTFRLQYRTPAGAIDGAAIRIYLNDHPQPAQQLGMSKKWENSSFTVNRDWVKDGVNKLVIVWPYLFRPLIPEGAILDKSILKLLFPVLGEIAGFDAFANKKGEKVPEKLYSFDKMNEIK